MQRPVVWAAIQLSSQGDVGANLERVASLVAEAARRGATLAVLPENFAYMGDEEGKRAIAEDLDGEPAAGPIARALVEAARASGVTVVAGGFPERSADPARPYNTCAVFAPAEAGVKVMSTRHVSPSNRGRSTRHVPPATENDGPSKSM